MKIAPHGTLNDGTLSLVTATGLSRCRALRSLLGVEDGTHVNRSYVSERKVLAMKVEFLSQRGFVVLDGEPIDLSPVRPSPSPTYPSCVHSLPQASTCCGFFFMCTHVFSAPSCYSSQPPFFFFTFLTHSHTPVCALFLVHSRSLFRVPAAGVLRGPSRPHATHAIMSPLMEGIPTSSFSFLPPLPLTTYSLSV